MLLTEHLSPVIAALASCAVVILVSNSFSGDRKFYFQASLFAAGLAASSSYLLLQARKDNALDPFLNAFASLPQEVRLVLSIFVITSVYFGGALYVGVVSPSGGTGLTQSFPASCDNVVDFETPDSLPRDDTKMFEDVFKRVTDEMVADLPTVYEMPEEAVAWVDGMIQYTVAGGKMNRGLAVVSVLQTFAKHRGAQLTDRERIQSAVLGWAVEFLQAFFLVADDVMDDSVTRRGQPCWFRLPHVKLIAVNDSFLLESCVFKMLKRYFGRETYYAQLVDIFIEVTRQTELGQLLDLTSQPQGSAIDLRRFTMQRYTAIVKYKTAFYSFYLPVALGMIVAGITSRAQYERAREILLIMGEYFQIQDDYLDCFGDPAVIGKVGTDIQDNKCSWLVVQALARADAKQRKVLEANYGQHEPKKVEAVKRLYDELQLRQAFAEYEDRSYSEIQSLLAGVTFMPKEVFEFLLRKIYKRSK
jgi:farnesyl diphosphate synthase